jgi:metallophosphoesterase superfamily enzyme
MKRLPRGLSVKDLRAILQTVDDETIVVLGSHDHGYRVVRSGTVEKAEVYSDGALSEFHGEEYTEEDPEIIPVLLID